MASREYLQCEPVEIELDEASFNLPLGGNQDEQHHTFYPAGATDTEINEHEMKNESFYEPIDYGYDENEEDHSDFANRNDYIEVIEERPSEEDYTSMKKNPGKGRYELIRN